MFSCQEQTSPIFRLYGSYNFCNLILGLQINYIKITVKKNIFNKMFIRYTNMAALTDVGTPFVFFYDFKVKLLITTTVEKDIYQDLTFYFSLNITS